MTRKRYVKLMMSHGMSRNLASALADAASGKDGGYARAYETDSALFRIAHQVAVRWDKMAEEVSKTCAAIVEGIGAGVSAFNEAYRKRMGME